MTSKQAAIKEPTRSILVSDVTVTSDEDSLKHELAQRYPGIEQVTRWYSDEDYRIPMTCIQVDFTSSKYTEKILRDGVVVIAGICRQVRPLRSARCYRCQQEGHKASECQLQRLTEGDMLAMFQQQNTQLSALMSTLEDKINNALAVRHEKTQASLQSGQISNGH